MPTMRSAVARLSEISVRLARPVERAVAHGHPWIYRDALKPFTAAPGSVATVLDGKGRFLARGLIEDGPIAVRVWTTRDRPIDAMLVASRLDEALALRDQLAPTDTNALRLIHGEGDRLPGLVVDRYDDHAMVRLDGASVEAVLRATGSRDLLLERLGARGVRNVLHKIGRGEGKQVEAWHGRVPQNPLLVLERGMKLLADLRHGQKTGLFLDHRDARALVRALSREQTVLNLYGYVGGFSIAAGLGGAGYVETVDVAAPAIALAERAWSVNGLPEGAHVGHSTPAEAFLHEAVAHGRRWSVVIADPPSFAPSAAAKPQALRAYKALHRDALLCVEPGGLYLAASCSSHVTREDFEATLRESAHAQKRMLTVLARLGAGFDHPIPLGFPEGEYLKSVLVRVHPR
jgi:23S rRNA (cytosine1962-C5)-methyltransferase